MDSTLALGAFRIARGAGGEAVDVNGNLVEREKHHLNLHLNLHLTSEWAVPRVAGRFSDSETSWVLAGAQRAVFCAVRVADFLAEGAGWGAPQGVAASGGAMVTGAAIAFPRVILGSGLPRNILRLSFFLLDQVSAAGWNFQA